MADISYRSSSPLSIFSFQPTQWCECSETWAIFETTCAGLLVSHASLVFSSMVPLLDRFWILYAVYLSTFVFGCVCCVSTFDFCCKRFCQEEGEDEESVNSHVSALEMDHGDITSDYAALL